MRAACAGRLANCDRPKELSEEDLPPFRAGEGSGDGATVYLAYSDAPTLRIRGFLITEAGNINALIAYCPICPGWPGHRTNPGEEILHQLRLAQKIAAAPFESHAEGALWLKSCGYDNRSVPHWIYGLSCRPLNPEWDGQFLHPRPFCPALFGEMAKQPTAAAWIKSQS